MKNEIRVSTFGIRHELGPMFLGYRAPDGAYTMRQVNDGPVSTTLVELPRRIRDGYGVSSVELMEQNLHDASPDDLIALREALESSGVKLGLLGLSRCAGDADPARRAEDISALEEFIDVAGRIGAQQVRVVLLPPPVVPSPEPADLPELVEALLRLARRAEAAGVRLMVENDDAITADPAQLLPILDAVGSQVGFVLDTGNIDPVMTEVVAGFMEGREAKDVDAEETYRTIQSLLPRAEVVHVKTYGFKPDGTSKVYDLQRVVTLLADAGFAGPVTIEYSGADGADADDAITRTIEIVRAA